MKILTILSDIAIKNQKCASFMHEPSRTSEQIPSRRNLSTPPSFRSLSSISHSSLTALECLLTESLHSPTYPTAPSLFFFSLPPSIDLATALSFLRYLRHPKLYSFLHHGPQRRPVCRALRTRPFWQGSPCTSETASQLDDNGVEEVTRCERPYPTLHATIECFEFADTV